MSLALQAFAAGMFCGAVLVGTAWATALCFARARRPHKQVIYRKGFAPEVIE